MYRQDTDIVEKFIWAVSNTYKTLHMERKTFKRGERESDSELWTLTQGVVWKESHGLGNDKDWYNDSTDVIVSAAFVTDFVIAYPVTFLAYGPLYWQPRRSVTQTVISSSYTLTLPVWTFTLSDWLRSLWPLTTNVHSYQNTRWESISKPQCTIQKSWYKCGFSRCEGYLEIVQVVKCTLSSTSVLRASSFWRKCWRITRNEVQISMQISSLCIFHCRICYIVNELEATDSSKLYQNTTASTMWESASWDSLEELVANKLIWQYLTPLLSTLTVFARIYKQYMKFPETQPAKSEYHWPSILLSNLSFDIIGPYARIVKGYGNDDDQ